MTSTTTAPGALDASAETAGLAAEEEVSDGTSAMGVVLILLVVFMAGMALGGYLAWIG